jgi:hypothetical protein
LRLGDKWDVRYEWAAGQIENLPVRSDATEELWMTKFEGRMTKDKSNPNDEFQMTKRRRSFVSSFEFRI